MLRHKCVICLMLITLFVIVRIPCLLQFDGCSKTCDWMGFDLGHMGNLIKRVGQCANHIVGCCDNPSKLFKKILSSCTHDHKPCMDEPYTKTHVMFYVLHAFAVYVLFMYSLCFMCMCLVVFHVCSTTNHRISKTL